MAGEDEHKPTSSEIGVGSEAQVPSAKPEAPNITAANTIQDILEAKGASDALSSLRGGLPDGPLSAQEPQSSIDGNIIGDRVLETPSTTQNNGKPESTDPELTPDIAQVPIDEEAALYDPQAHDMQTKSPGDIGTSAPNSSPKELDPNVKRLLNEMKTRSPEEVESARAVLAALKQKGDSRAHTLEAALSAYDQQKGLTEVPLDEHPEGVVSDLDNIHIGSAQGGESHPAEHAEQVQTQDPRKEAQPVASQGETSEGDVVGQIEADDPGQAAVLQPEPQAQPTTPEVESVTRPREGQDGQGNLQEGGLGKQENPSSKQYTRAEVNNLQRQYDAVKADIDTKQQEFNALNGKSEKTPEDEARLRTLRSELGKQNRDARQILSELKQGRAQFKNNKPQQVEVHSAGQDSVVTEKRPTEGTVEGSTTSEVSTTTSQQPEGSQNVLSQLRSEKNTLDTQIATLEDKIANGSATSEEVQQYQSLKTQRDNKERDIAVQVNASIGKLEEKLAPDVQAAKDVYEAAKQAKDAAYNKLGALAFWGEPPSPEEIQRIRDEMQQADTRLEEAHAEFIKKNTEAKQKSISAGQNPEEKNSNPPIINIEFPSNPDATTTTPTPNAQPTPVSPKERKQQLDTLIKTGTATSKERLEYAKMVAQDRKGAVESKDGQKNIPQPLTNDEVREANQRLNEQEDEKVEREAAEKAWELVQDGREGELTEYEYDLMDKYKMGKEDTPEEKKQKDEENKKNLAELQKTLQGVEMSIMMEGDVDPEKLALFDRLAEALSEKDFEFSFSQEMAHGALEKVIKLTSKDVGIKKELTEKLLYLKALAKRMRELNVQQNLDNLTSMAYEKKNQIAQAEKDLRDIENKLPSEGKEKKYEDDIFVLRNEIITKHGELMNIKAEGTKLKFLMRELEKEYSRTMKEVKDKMGINKRGFWAKVVDFYVGKCEDIFDQWDKEMTAVTDMKS